MCCILIFLLGFYNPDSNTGVYYSCPIGIKSALNSTTCLYWPSSQPSSQPSRQPSSQPSTYKCSVGFYSSTGISPCTICSAGTYTPYIQATVCSYCAKGYYSSSGLLPCTACPRGMYSINSATSCISCPMGTYASNSGTASCATCKYSLYPGAVLCVGVFIFCSLSLLL